MYFFFFFNYIFNFLSVFFLNYFSKFEGKNEIFKNKLNEKFLSWDKFQSIVNYFSKHKIVKNGIDKNIGKKKNINYVIDNCIKTILDSKIDSYEDINLNVSNRIEKVRYSKVWVKIAVWNCQRLNKLQTNQRYVKLEFLRDLLNENRFDIIYLVDIDDKQNVVHLNGYRKILEGRNILFIKNYIYNEFFVSKNIIYDARSKLAFVYATPNIADKVFKNNIHWLVLNKYTLIGDFNLKSNKWLNDWVVSFDGEDSLQSGILNAKNCKNCISTAAPSDHKFISAFVKIDIAHGLNLKTKEISYRHSYDVVNDICKGLIPKFEPKIVVNKGLINLNDRENTVNFMIADFLNGNVKKIYKKYNYLWKGNKREPFLGTVVPESVVKSFAKHYLENKNKEYKVCENANIIDNEFFNKLIIKKTKSKALNNEFVSLSNISKALNEIWTSDNVNKKEIFNNIINVANRIKSSLNAQTFFLQKNSQLRDCNDVRTIVIVPTVLKMYESIVFDCVVDYVSALFNVKELYQFGGVRRGSCFAAMQVIRLKLQKFKSDSILMLDLSKGYDSIKFDVLDNCINEYIDDERIRLIMLNWSKMASNINIVMNNYKIKKDRGIAMGLSLSPIIFVLYVDFALKSINKDCLIMYIDDLSIIIRDCISKDKGNTVLVNQVIENLNRVGLVINKEKTKLLSSNPSIIAEFDGEFEVVEEDKFLGRKLLLTSDGIIIADNRFYNLRGFRVKACPYWATFFIKRLIHISSLEAKLRYKTFMWAIGDTATICAIWRNNWAFFKSAMGLYSYVQMVFSVFNLFRYSIDAVDILKWKIRIKQNENIEEINKEVINKIKASEIPQIADCFDQIKVKWNFIEDNEWDYTKLFLQSLWNQFQMVVLDKYINSKKEQKIKVYPKIKQYVKSKIYNHFACVQKVVFKHMSFKNRVKQLIIIEAIKIAGKFAKECVSEFKNGICNSHNVYDLVKLINPIEKKYWDIEKVDVKEWEYIFCDECERAWPEIDTILELMNVLKLKVNKTKNIENDKWSDAVDIFVDGCFNVESQQAGYGYFIDGKGTRIKNNGIVPDEYVNRSLQNIAGELWGTLEAIKFAIANKIDRVNLYYDYEGIKNYALNIWYSTNNFIKNIYIPAISSLRNKIKINFIHVYSHSGNYGNEIADQMAKKAVNINIKNQISNSNKDNKVIDEVMHKHIKNNYKCIFKFLTVAEMIMFNNNLNGLNPDELLFTFKLKVNAVPDLLDNLWQLTEYEDLNPVDFNYCDLYLE